MIRTKRYETDKSIGACPKINFEIEKEVCELIDIFMYFDVNHSHECDFISRWDYALVILCLFPKITPSEGIDRDAI